VCSDQQQPAQNINMEEGTRTTTNNNRFIAPFFGWHIVQLHDPRLSPQQEAQVARRWVRQCHPLDRWRSVYNISSTLSKTTTTTTTTMLTGGDDDDGDTHGGTNKQNWSSLTVNVFISFRRRLLLDVMRTLLFQGAIRCFTKKSHMELLVRSFGTAKNDTSQLIAALSTQQNSVTDFYQ
jgi:hypothetical protein